MQNCNELRTPNEADKDLGSKPDIEPKLTFAQDDVDFSKRRKTDTILLKYTTSLAMLNGCRTDENIKLCSVRSKIDHQMQMSKEQRSVLKARKTMTMVQTTNGDEQNQIVHN